MKYKNTKTGFVFESKSKVEGPEWVEVKTEAKAPRKKTATKPKKEVKK